MRIEDFDRLEAGVQDRILNHKSTILNVVVVSVAQLAERWTVAPEAVGSKPSAHPTTGLSVDDCRLGIGLFRSIRNPKSAICNWFSGAPVAQVDRAAGFEPAGREFNPLRAHQQGPRGWHGNNGGAPPVGARFRLLLERTECLRLAFPSRTEPSSTHRVSRSGPVRLSSGFR